MTFSEKNITDTLRIAEQVELRDSEEQWVGDLANHLTPENIAKGVTLHLDGDLESLTRIIEMFAIDERIKSGELNVLQAIASHDISTSFIGMFIPTIKKYGIQFGLDVLQATRWSTRQAYNDQSVISVEETEVVSSIFVGSTIGDNSDESTVLDKASPALSISAKYSYIPSAIDGYGSYASINGAYNRTLAHKMGDSKALTAFAEELKYADKNLLMPGRSYSVSIGYPDIADWQPFLSVTHGSQFYLKNGRFIEQADLFDD